MDQLSYSHLHDDEDQEECLSCGSTRQCRCDEGHDEGED